MAIFKFNDESVLASLSLGSRTFSCAVFQKSGKDPLDILSFAEERSAGIENGQIIDFNRFVATLNQVLESAEESSQTSFSRLRVGFNPPFSFLQSQGMATLSSKETEWQDMEAAVEAASAVPLPEGHICLHKDPEAFSIDGGRNILNPIGLSGLRLSADVRLITVPNSACKDLLSALRHIGQTPVSLLHELPTLSQNLIGEEEKQEGICFCDIGYKNTRLLVFHRGKTIAMFSIPIGGWHFSHALALKFHLSFERAEELKIKEGNLFSDPFGLENAIEAGGALYLPRKLFAQTLEKQAEDLLMEIKKALMEKNLMEKIPSGFVFSGGSSLLPGLLQLASFQLGKRVESTPELYDRFEKTKHFALIMQAERQKNQREKSSYLSWPFSKVKDLF